MNPSYWTKHFSKSIYSRPPNRVLGSVQVRAAAQNAKFLYLNKMNSELAPSKRFEITIHSGLTSIIPLRLLSLFPLQPLFIARLLPWSFTVFQILTIWILRSATKQKNILRPPRPNAPARPSPICHATKHINNMLLIQVLTSSCIQIIGHFVFYSSSLY